MLYFFVFNDTATTEIYTLSLHDALPILIQDFKAGQLLGGTPWKMQVVEIIAVVVLAFFLMGPIIALHEANLDTGDRKSTRLNSSHANISYAVFCLKKNNYSILLMIITSL